MRSPFRTLAHVTVALLVVACGAGRTEPPRAVPGETHTAASPPSATTQVVPTPPSATPATFATSAAPEAPAPSADSSADAGPPALPAGTTILHIGDSFAGALGIDLDRELKEVGIRGVLKYKTATYIPTWASAVELEQYLSRYRPDLVLITLGANELGIPDPSARIPTIHRLIARLGGRPCVWIGPPLWKGARPALLETIRTHCAPCVYLDSSALVPDLPRTRDHIHPSMDARKTWAKAVMGWLAAHRAEHGSRPWDMLSGDEAGPTR